MTRRDGASKPVEPGGIVGIVGCHVHMTKVMFGGGRGGGLSGDSGVECGVNAGFRAAARVTFLASPRKGTKRRGTLTPGPAGFPALLSRAGRLRNSPPAGAQTVLAENPPPALRCSAGGGRVISSEAIWRV